MIPSGSIPHPWHDWLMNGGIVFMTKFSVMDDSVDKLTGRYIMYACMWSIYVCMYVCMYMYIHIKLDILYECGGK